MKNLTLAAAVAALITASPAQATLQIALQIGPDAFFCADNTACDLNSAVGTIEVGNQTIDGITVDGSIQASVHGPLPSLNTSSLDLINITSAPVVATVAVGDDDYAATLIKAQGSAAGTWQGPGGSSISASWFIDPANHQGANTAFDTPGTLLDTFSNASTGQTGAFSHNTPGTIFDLTAPFSMTEQATIVLTPGGNLVNRGQALVGLAVPEPSTWALALAGFAALALMGWKRTRAA